MKILETGLVGLAPRRRRAGFTQEKFAEAIGVNRSAVAMWEARGTWPSSSLLPVIADVLLCSIDDLYEVPENILNDKEAEIHGA